MSKFINVLFILAIVFNASNVTADWFGNAQQKAKERAMCYSNYEARVENILIDKVPSIMESCGIGSLYDFCGKLGKFGSLFGEALGCGGGGAGGGSQFCDWGFNKESAKEAWKMYTGSIGAVSEESMYASNLDVQQTAAKVLGINLE